MVMLQRLALQRGFKGYLEILSRLILASVFVVAAVPKLFEPVQFAQVIAQYGLIPDSLILLTAVLLPVAELAAAITLLVKKDIGLWLTGLLYALFIGVLLYGISLGLDIDCGCFGEEDPEHRAFSGLRTALVRDLLLLIPFSYLLVSRFRTQFLPIK